MQYRAKQCDISPKVRQAVLLRDSWDDCTCCVLCGKPRPETLMHYIPRSAGGLGIEENLVAGCIQCHHDTDHTTKREQNLERIREYLDQYYPGFEDEYRVYEKGERYV